MKSTLLLGTVCLLAIGWLSCMNPPTTPQEQTSTNDTIPTDTAGYQQWVEYIASQKALLPQDRGQRYRHAGMGQTRLQRHTVRLVN